MAKKFIYYFSEGSDAFAGDKVTMKNTLGGKGANLAEMTSCRYAGARRASPSPPRPAPSTTTDGRQINAEIQAEIMRVPGQDWRRSPARSSATSDNPLLVSVRSGARASMPGMMDTILNLGLNDDVVEGLAKKTDNPRFAYDSYRRFIQMFSDVVMELSKKPFEEHHRRDEGGQGRQDRRRAGPPTI